MVIPTIDVHGSPWERYEDGTMSDFFYTPEGIGQIYLWLKVDIAVAAVQEKKGRAKIGTAAALRRVKLNPARVLEIQKAGENHQQRAFLKHVQEEMVKNGDGEFTAFVHLDLTSCDVQDTATALMLMFAADTLIDYLKKLEKVIVQLAIRYKRTPMIGRTHGIHGKPITFGKKCIDWLSLTRRSIKQMKVAKREIAVGKISGAMGIYTQDPEIEELVCKKLGLKPADASTQIICRDEHALFFSRVVLVASRIGVIAEAIRLGQQTDRQELEEPFKSTGSSAMPHKRNPEICERLLALLKKIRANLIPFYENIITWDERALDQSATERLAFPEVLVLTAYLVKTMTTVLIGLKVNEEQMARNIERTAGAIYAEDVKSILQESGIGQNEAYDLVKDPAQKAYLGRGHFIDNCLQVPEITALLSRDQLVNICQPRFDHIDAIYKRFGI